MKSFLVKDSYSNALFEGHNNINKLINGLEKSCDNEANLIVFTHFSHTSEHGKTLLIAFNILTLNRKQSIYLFHLTITPYHLTITPVPE